MFGRWYWREHSFWSDAQIRSRHFPKGQLLQWRVRSTARCSVSYLQHSGTRLRFCENITSNWKWLLLTSTELVSLKIPMGGIPTGSIFGDNSMWAMEVLFVAEKHKEQIQWDGHHRCFIRMRWRLSQIGVTSLLCQDVLLAVSCYYKTCPAYTEEWFTFPTSSRNNLLPMECMCIMCCQHAGLLYRRSSLHILPPLCSAKVVPELRMVRLTCVCSNLLHLKWAFSSLRRLAISSRVTGVCRSLYTLAVTQPECQPTQLRL